MSKKMNYESKWGDVNVELSMSQYTDNGNIYLELVNTEGEYPEPYGNITVNLGGVPKYCGYVDTNNMPEMEKFLEENDLVNNSDDKGRIEFFDSSNSEYKRERFFSNLKINVFNSKKCS